MQLSKNHAVMKNAVAEMLESRRLFAVTIYPGTYSLTIYGTTGADNIVVSKSGNNIKLVLDATTTKTYPYANIRSLFVYLEEGNDKFTADNSLTQYMQVDGNFGKDTITTGGGNDSIFSGNEDDKVNGGDGKDTIDGGTGNDIINGNGGNDSLNDGTGSDQVFGGSGNDVLDAGVVAAGADLYDGGDGIDWLFYHDRITAVSITTDGIANDGKKPATGYNSLEKDNVSASIEAMSGTDYADRIKLSGNVNNTIYGSGGNDNIDAGPGNDRIDAGYAQAVTVYGGTGNDIISTGTGNDVVYAGDGNDKVMSGRGSDAVYGGSGDDSLEGQPGIDNLYGEAGKDTLKGGDDNDYLSGGNGNDVLNGESGNDYLTGGADNDILFGGNGFDRMYGDAGSDQIFAFDRVYYEIVDGGSGVDVANIDRFLPLNTPGDVLSSIESWG